MNHPTLYRKRFIPDECVLLKDDVFLEYSPTRFVTKWSTIRQKSDFSSGYSCFYLDQGFRISKFLDDNNNLVCWYCDIITHELDEKNNTLTIIDLLADVIIFPDGKIRVVDLDELSEAFEKRLIDETLLKKSLLSLNKLLTTIYDDGLDSLIRPIEDLKKPQSVENMSSDAYSG